MMTEATKKVLSQPTIEADSFHAKLLTHCKGLIDISRSAMSHYYSDWDERQRVYRARRHPDREDRNADKHDEPIKQVFPISYAQIDTFIAFAFLLLRQRQYLYEFEASGKEDYGILDASEDILARDMRENKQAHLLYQFLLDVARFGLGCTKCAWSEEYVWLPVQNVPEAKDVLGEAIPSTEPPTTSWEKFLRFEGNKVINVSPYRVFPDTRLPMSRYQEGEFCGSEDEVSKVALLRGQKAGVYCGVAHVGVFQSQDSDKRKTYGSRMGDNKWSDPKEFKNYCVTELVVDLVPCDWDMGTDVDGKKLGTLGDQDFPIRYVVAYANDNRVIRCEPFTQIAPGFPIFIGQFSPDQHELINQSLAEIIARLQEVIDWFVNSRVASVRRTLDNQLVIDPSGIDMATVNNRSRVILMKKGAARTGVERYLKQLAVSDVTAHHMQDAAQFTAMTQSVSGINDNMMGQINTGRRSSYEARAVTQGAASRVRKVVELLWEAVFQPQGVTMLTNHRQNISRETFDKILGEDSTDELFTQFKASTALLVQNNDLFVFDGSLPSEKMFVAQALQELLGMLLASPQAAVQFNIDPKLVLDELYSLRGVGKIERFGFSQMDQMKQQIMMALTQQSQTPPANGLQPSAAA